MFGMPGGSEWILLLLAIVILFGAKKIPELMRGIGTGIKEFKKAASTDDEEENAKKIENKETKS